ncbi:MAG: GntR family transcriptional regulator [Solirubrobacterales bacterium]|nr:GntR family transcriptional regulator [Solirubrobacterales bacterium]
MAATDDRVHRTSLSAQIADALRADIVFGRVEPGTRMGQQQLCERFGTSRMPVRDALRELTYEGLLTPDKGGHAVVAKMSRSYIEDSYVIDGILQGLAAQRTAGSATPEQIAELRALHERMLEVEDNPVALGELNRQFHDLIVGFAGSRKLEVALRAISMSMPTNASFLTQFPEWRKRVGAEHEAIIAAIEGGDGDRADELMREHVAAAGRHLTRYLREHDVPLD